MSRSSHYPNYQSRKKAVEVRLSGNDFLGVVLQTQTMAGKPKSRGYAMEWLLLADRKQADLVRLLGYSKAKANAVWHGEQRLNEDILEQLAPLANARPYELLMDPETAMRLRRLEAALREAAKEPAPEPKAPEPRHVRKVS